MKAWIVCSLVATAAIVAVSGARATHNPTANPPRDFAVGRGEVADVAPLGGLDVVFQISATSGPLGENPHGHVMVDIEDNPLQSAPVTCIVTTGNRATAGGPRTGAPGSSLFVYVEDNEVGPDRVSTATSSVNAADQAGCLFFHLAFQTAANFVVTRGDYTVHDGFPRP